MNIRAIKKQVHAELSLRYKEYLESRLALALLDQVTLLPVVDRLSNVIFTLLNDNKATIIKLISATPQIKRELYEESYYGRLREKISSDNLSAEDVFDDITSVLQHRAAQLDKIMQVHSVFFYRIYHHINRHFDPKSAKEHCLQDRSRLEKTTGLPPLSTQLGITKCGVFTKKITKTGSAHLRALDRYLPDQHATFFQAATRMNMPFVAGPSGHTYTFLHGAKALGIHALTDLQEYALACFVFLAAGGNHSFYEVMAVAERFGLASFDGNYQISLPESFKQTECYQNLATEFGL